MYTIGFRAQMFALTVTACMLCASTTLGGHKPGHDPGGDSGGGGPGAGGPAFAYELNDLLGLPGDGMQSEGWFVNDRDGMGNSLIYGVALEYVDGISSHQEYPVLWHVDPQGNFPSSDPTNLGLPAFAKNTNPAGINSTGVRIGNTAQPTEQDQNGDFVLPGFVQVPGLGYQELPSPVTRNTGASGVNDLGTIVGNYQILSHDPLDNDGLKWVGGLWQLQSDGSISDPISLGDFIPRDINNHGVIAGVNQGYPAIAWFEGTELKIESLDTSLRYQNAGVRAINDYDVGDERLALVGRSVTNEAGEFDVAYSRLGFAWRPFDASDPTTLLGTLGGNASEAYDVNDEGQIVGKARTRQGYYEAFLYADGNMQNLNDLVDTGRAVLEVALGINNDGDIVGAMDYDRPISELHGFLLTSPTSAAATVPEPHSLGMAAMGALILGSLTCRHRGSTMGRRRSVSNWRI